MKKNKKTKKQQRNFLVILALVLLGGTVFIGPLLVGWSDFLGTGLVKKNEGDLAKKTEPSTKSKETKKNSEKQSQTNLLAEYPLCKEIINGHNNLENKVNWVFVGFDFLSLNSLRQVVFEAVDYGTSSSKYSLLNISPFASNRNKINVWYVDKVGEHGDMLEVISNQNPKVNEASILRLCPEFKNQHVVIFQDSYNIPKMLDTVKKSAYFGNAETTAGTAPVGRGKVSANFENYLRTNKIKD